MSVMETWRNRDSRYRLTGSVGPDGEIHFPPRPAPQENRNLGAAGAITKTNGGSEQVLVFDDSSGTKFKETAGDLLHWRPYYEPPNLLREGSKHHPSWSIHGGGRQLGETFTATLTREEQEELHIWIEEQEMIQAIIGQLALFFAAQYPRVDSIKPNIFAVRTVLLDLQKFSKHIQLQINQLVENESHPQAKWVELTHLADLYQALRDGERPAEATQYRPHTLAAAFIWQLEKTLSSEEVAQQMDAINRRGFRSVVNQSPNGYNNGAFSLEEGSILPADQLNRGEAEFLYGDLLALPVIKQIEA